MDLRRYAQPLRPSPPALMGRAHGGAGAPRLEMGLAMGPAIGACLPGGRLPLGVLHALEPAPGAEVQHGAVVAGFAARVLARIAGTWLWVAAKGDLHAPGLVACGLDPARLVLAAARDDAAVLATMETALRGGAFAAVVGEAGRLPRLAARRLQLACRRHGCTGLLLHRWPYGRPAGAAEEAPKGQSGEQSSAVTRWRIGAVASGDIFAPPRWRLELLHARGGVPGEWIVEAGERDAPDLVCVVAELADLAAAPQRRRLG